MAIPIKNARRRAGVCARYDDLLEISVWVQSHKGVRIEIACEIRRKGEEKVLISGFTRHAFVSLKDFRPCPPPERFIKLVTGEVE